jgi:hypothetical protein
MLELQFSLQQCEDFFGVKGMTPDIEGTNRVRGLAAVMCAARTHLDARTVLRRA